MILLSFGFLFLIIIIKIIQLTKMKKTEEHGNTAVTPAFQRLREMGNSSQSGLEIPYQNIQRSTPGWEAIHCDSYSSHKSAQRTEAGSMLKYSNIKTQVLQ